MSEWGGWELFHKFDSVTNPVGHTGFPAEPGKPGDLNFIFPGPEMACNLSQNVRKPGQNKKFSRKSK